MIFVTIGSMFPFDRLIRVMDEWAISEGRTDVVAQIGNGSYEPKNMKFGRYLDQSEFAENMKNADLIVAHAGMGSVITAGRTGRPIVLLPRIKEWGEHTTNHQLATANWLRDKLGIFVADTDADLPDVIKKALSAEIEGGARFAPVADKAFTDRLRAAIVEPKNK